VSASAPDDAYDAGEFRRLAAGLTELAARWIETPADAPQTAEITAGAALARFAEPLPRRGTTVAALLERIERDYLADAHRLHHPRYVGHQVAPPLPVAGAIDVLASTMNNGMAIWEMSPTGTPVEHAVLGWFAAELGWPAGFGGTFVSGGAVGNLTALAAARAHARPEIWNSGVGAARLAIVTSEAAHYCIERAAGLMGLGREAVLSVRTVDGCMDPAAAAERIDGARAAGREVIALVGTAGTTALGAIDDLNALADVAEARELWFHVDAAHGGSFLLSPRLRALLSGLERADSVAIDLHKMMLQPISTALLLVRERARLARAFAQDAPYLFDADAGEPVDLGGLTLQCSRRADALRAWATLQLHGADGIAALQEYTVDLTRAVAETLAARADFELAHRPRTNILCFRHVPPRLAGDERALDRHQDALRERLRRDRFAYLTGTLLDGRRVLRMTLINPRTRLADVVAILDRIESLAALGA
jgi:L-2,4-diaminobutyrate decarboxylase